MPQVRNYVVLERCLTGGAAEGWSFLWARLSHWVFSLGFLAGLHLPAQIAATPPCLPPHQEALVLRDAAGHRAQPTLESVGIKPGWGWVCDEILALCRGEISSQTLLWRQVSAEILKFVNSLYPQLHRENLCCTEMSEHLTAFINCWRGFVQEKKKHFWQL